MKIFEGFAPASRVWVYQSNRPFSASEEQKLNERSKKFTENWTAHDDQLKAAAVIMYHRFIVFAVDENIASVSGCSIDKSVNYIKQVEKDLNVFLLNRQLIAYKNDEVVVSSPLNVFIELYKQGKVNSDTIVFNNMVDTLATFQSEWEIPLNKSWIFGQIPMEKAF